VIELVIVRAERGRYSAVLGERVLCTVKEPFFAAARILVAEGVDPETVLTMRHQGSQIRGLTMTLGRAARLMVKEGDVRGLEIVPYAPSPFAPIKPPASQNDEALAGPPSENN
jgi:hypothetical protein